MQRTDAEQEIIVTNTRIGRDEMKRKSVKLIFAVLLILPFLAVNAVDDGSRCATCGKLTFRGGNHICKPRKKTPTMGFYVPTKQEKTRSSDSSASNSSCGIQNGNKQTYIVSREHSFNIVSAYACGHYFQVRVLANGDCNYLIYRKYERGNIGCIIFNDDAVYSAAEAFKTAIRKASRWIGIGRKRNKTLPNFKDMEIDVPGGCGINIPNAIDKWDAFVKLAQAPNLKQIDAGFRFCFTDKIRILRFQCGEASLDFDWMPDDDDKVLRELGSACDAGFLLQLYNGKEGESSLFSMDQSYKELPSVKTSCEIPKWQCKRDAVATMAFPNCRAGTRGLTLSECSNGRLNYSFSPQWFEGYYNNLLIFPDDSYDAAYRALEVAFKTALAWRDVAKRRRVLNIVKEIEIPCPESAGVKITGTRGIEDVFRQAIRDENVIRNAEPTRFWFSVETQPVSMDGRYAFVQNEERNRYFLYFGSLDVHEVIELNDSSVAVFGQLNPQLALREIRKRRQSRANEDALFK